MEKTIRGETTSSEPKFVEGRDYYFEKGLLVMTEEYLRRRGYCCENGCRHCPYGYCGSLKKENG
ncbi:MAG: hypothetical protein IPM50_08405 [Acidobacteriota bacterium]|nr:MAG: hypothetical protein IPM50_08405 [Acidobacteriota bacterium]